MSPPRVVAVVPVFDRRALTERFLESFAAVTYPRCQLVIVDDASLDGTAEMLDERHPSVTVLRGDGGLFWAGATNLGVRWALQSGCEYVLTINNDVEVEPDFLDRLVATAEANPRSLVGCRLNALHRRELVYACGAAMQWEQGRILDLVDHGRPTEAVLASRPHPFEVDVLTGCGTLVPAPCYREVGLYDARFCPQYHADADLVLRATARGYRALVALDAVIYNDAATTWQGAGSLAELLLSPRSADYWRPIAKVHLAHCPRRWLAYSLAARYLPHVLPGPAHAGTRRRWLSRLRPR